MALCFHDLESLWWEKAAIIYRVKKIYKDYHRSSFRNPKRSCHHLNTYIRLVQFINHPSWYFFLDSSLPHIATLLSVQRDDISISSSQEFCFLDDWRCNPLLTDISLSLQRVFYECPFNHHAGAFCYPKSHACWRNIILCFGWAWIKADLCKTYRSTWCGISLRYLRSLYRYILYNWPVLNWRAPFRSEPLVHPVCTICVR
jgi:hypothetical protein